jgi:hypothetical protein
VSSISAIDGKLMVNVKLAVSLAIDGIRQVSSISDIDSKRQVSSISDIAGKRQVSSFLTIHGKDC